MIMWVVLLFVSTSWCARIPIDSCKKSGCHVSDLSLDSALSTFLCFTEEEYGAMGELEKKQNLAKKIAPQLLSEDGDEVPWEKLVDMDPERLVGLSNLVLHNRTLQAQDGERKTEGQYINKVIDELVQKTKLNPHLFERVNPHFLALMNCDYQNGTKEDNSLAPKPMDSMIISATENSSKRGGRGAFLTDIFSGLFPKASKASKDPKAAVSKAAVPKGEVPNCAETGTVAGIECTCEGAGLCSVGKKCTLAKDGTNACADPAPTTAAPTTEAPTTAASTTAAPTTTAQTTTAQTTTTV